MIVYAEVIIPLNSGKWDDVVVGSRLSFFSTGLIGRKMLMDVSSQLSKRHADDPS
jgi:hypothetical protein